MPTSPYPRALRSILRASLAVAALLLAGPVQAQFDTGQLSGVVRDAQGGVVPGAAVRIIHEQTRLERNIVTDASGYYVAPALPLGRYQVEVEIPGFRKFV